MRYRFVVAVMLVLACIGVASAAVTLDNISAYGYIGERFNWTGSGINFTYWTPPAGVSCIWVGVVGGGGSGGKFPGGGGGAGAVVKQYICVSGQQNVTIGDGGAAVTANVQGNKGVNSTFGTASFNISAEGGGGGGGNSLPGLNGGSGGGGSDVVGPAGGTATNPLWGNNGGTGAGSSSGGGGGAGSIGVNGVGTTGASGGNQTTMAITGSDPFGCGGSGSGSITGGTSIGVCNGVGGNGGVVAGATSGKNSTGSGGGGTYNGGTSGRGGSGTVVIWWGSGLGISFTQNGVTTNTSGANPFFVQFNDTSLYNATVFPEAGIWTINDTVIRTETATAGRFTDAFNISQTFPLGTHIINLTHYNTSVPFTISVIKNVTVNQTIVADFNRTPDWANPYLGNADELINFVDMSTGASLNQWKWDFGDYNTSSTRNPWYGYNKTGTFNVNLTVWGADGHAHKNWTDCVRINQNHTFTLQIRDSDTFNLITNLVTVQLSQLGVDYTSGTTSTGIIDFELPDGAYDVLVPAVTGVYSGNIASVTMAGTDADGTIYLDPVSSGTKTTWYSPHQVKFDVVDTNGVDTTGFIVNASYTDMSLPLASTVSWLQNLYGISSEVAGDMVNSSLVMNATVGNDGSVAMTMHESIQYRIQVFDPTTGTSSSITLYPKDSEYKLFITTTATTASTLSEINGTRLTFYEPNMSYVTPGLEYQDTSGKTQYFNFSVRCINNGTYVYWQNVSAPGTALRLVNTTFPNVRGEMYTWAYTATRT